MIPRPAQYLVRFDDLCLTMDRTRWQRFLPLIGQYGIRPILAVVPDNGDPELQVSEPDPAFWDEMRELEAAGAMIGMHGYRHLCASRGRSLLPLHRASEFAGVPEVTQKAWIRAGWEMLRRQGLHPRIWVAPRHGFDGNTLRALRGEGITLVSDGFARCPAVRQGLTWIPQQLWAPVEKPKGVWTICLHSNTASDALVRELETFVRQHAQQFTSVDRVLSEFVPARLSLGERIREAVALRRVLVRQRRRKVLDRD